MPVIQLGIFHAGLSKAVNHSIQKHIDKPNLYARRLPAEHGKALLCIFADFNRCCRFFALSWFAHAPNVFHPVNAIGQHLVLFFIVSKQIIIPIVNQ